MLAISPSSGKKYEVGNPLHAAFARHSEPSRGLSSHFTSAAHLLVSQVVSLTARFAGAGALTKSLVTHLALIHRVGSVLHLATIAPDSELAFQLAVGQPFLVGHSAPNAKRVLVLDGEL